ncbi:MAG: glycosyltransferase [Planctomycetes bacterium]|nr:glycosyltransferase [Planctomycetota bacterium]
MESETAWWLVGVAGLVFWGIKIWPMALALRHPRFLSAVRVPADGTAPRVSVIVPARDEGESIRACLDSLLTQSYENIEIIAVNDRSTDETGRVMDEFAGRDKRVRVIHVSELPNGWLGKNHANEAGAEQATGDYILFTDGDVLFAPDALRRAIRHMRVEGLDHLCVFPGMITDGYFERAAVCFFGILFYVALRLRQVRNPLEPRAFCGIGAFNLVRTRAYRAFGGHEPLRMEVADDAKLGKLMKMNGFVTDVLEGRPDVRVRWQKGWWGVVTGLEKNGFAGSDYLLGKSLAGIAGVVLLGVAPLIGLAFAPGWSRLPYGLLLLSEVSLLARVARQQGFSRAVGFAFPIAALTLAYAVGRSVVLTLVRGGIRWRGTFYPLADLRRGVV